MNNNSELFKGDLFNNPMIENARKSMSKQDLERYEDWGHAVFDDIDYETVNEKKYPNFVVDAVANIINSIQSGLHPSFLNKEERNLLKEVKGECWYKEFGFIEEDLDTISDK